MPSSKLDPNSYKNILSQRQDQVGIIKLNRSAALNALSSELMKELLEALNGFDNDDSIYCIILTGSDKVFSAGADIKEMSAQSSVEALKEGNLERFDSISKIRKPIIAAVAGYCFGGGLELAMACDIIIVAENARLGQPEINIGVMPGAGGTQRLTRAIGKYKAMDLILTGRQITGREAFELGLVSRVVPDESYLTEAKRAAAELCTKSPLALKIAKECVTKAYESSLSEGLEFEHKNFYFLMGSEDKQEGMKAFTEKRRPVFKGK
jgi:enoyl-CoA hydratase